MQQNVDGEQPRDNRSPPWFWPSLVGATVLGMAFRVGLAINLTHRPLTGDSAFFHATAANIAAGKGYAEVTNYGPVHLGLVATAGHPPVFPTFLAFLDLIGFNSVESQRLVVAVLTSASVLLMGLLGRRVANPVVGLIAAGLAAVDPLWFQPSAILMSESIYLVIIPALLLTAVICLENPSWWRFGELGVLIGVSLLIRSEAGGLIIVLGIPLVLLVSKSWSQRLKLYGVLIAGLLLVTVPWVIRNEVQLGGFTIADDAGGTLAGSYCAGTIDPHSLSYGGFDLGCTLGAAGYDVQGPPPRGDNKWTELELNDVLTSSSLRFARGHIADLPGTVLAREAAVWGFPNQRYETILSNGEGRVERLENLGQVMFWVEIPFVLFGAFKLATTSRRKFVVVVLPIVLVALNAAAFYGSTRMRVAAEPSLAVFVAIGLVATARLIADRRSRSGDRSPESAGTADPAVQPGGELEPSTTGAVSMASGPTRVGSANPKGYEASRGSSVSRRRARRLLQGLEDTAYDA